MHVITIAADVPAATADDPPEYDKNIFHPQVGADGRCEWCLEVADERPACQGLLDPYVDDDGFNAQYADARVIFLGGAS